MVRSAETALEERDRAQETAATLRAQIEAFTERITKLEDRIHHVTFANKRLEAELQEAKLESIRASKNPGNILQMAIDASGLQEQPPHQEESVGPLDNIIEGFQPPPLDFQTRAQIQQFESIQAQFEAQAERGMIQAPAAQPPVEAYEAAPGAELPLPQEQLPTDAALPSFVGAAGPPMQAGLPVRQAAGNTYSEHDMGVSLTASVPTFEQLLQATGEFNAQPVQAAVVNAWPADPATAMNEQPVLAPEASAAAMDTQPEPTPDVLVLASAQATKTTEQRLNAMDEKISLILGVLEQMQQKKSAAQPPTQPPTVETAVRPVQQPPSPVPALQPQVMLTPFEIPTLSKQKPAHANSEVVCAKPARPPFGVNPGGKAPREMADIRAYQRAHRDPKFTETETDEDESEEREANEQQRQLASPRLEGTSAPKQKNAVTKRKLQLFADDSFSERNASAVDSAMDMPGKNPIDPSSVDSDCEEDVEELVVKPKNNKAQVKQSNSTLIVNYIS